MSVIDRSLPLYERELEAKRLQKAEEKKYETLSSAIGYKHVNEFICEKRTGKGPASYRIDSVKGQRKSKPLKIRARPSD